MQLKHMDMNAEKNQIVPGMLYLVATPIGNLSDLSERALKVLAGVDFVAAEDTRNSGLLLSRFGINKPMLSYFEHNKRERGQVICSRLTAGESCALITDAGMPAISDPGEDLVALCAQRGIPVTAVPGCCAAVTALALSGLSTGRFAFEGFLTTAKSDRRARLEELASERRTLIFYEAPHKLKRTLADFIAAFGGERKIALCRELTKLNEEILRTTLAEAASLYEQKDPRGEYVLILEGASHQAAAAAYPTDPREHVEQYIASGMERMDAIKAAAKDRGVPKGQLYKELLTENP